MIDECFGKLNEDGYLECSVCGSTFDSELELSNHWEDNL